MQGIFLAPGIFLARPLYVHLHLRFEVPRGKNSYNCSLRIWSNSYCRLFVFVSGALKGWELAQERVDERRKYSWYKENILRKENSLHQECVDELTHKLTVTSNKTVQ